MKRWLVIMIALVTMVGCQSVNTDPKPDPIPEPQPQEPTYDVIPFTLKGVSYELPVSYQTLLENGWEANTDIDQEIEGNTFVRNLFLRNDDNIIKVSFYNPTDSVKMLEDVLIAEIEAENRTFGGDVAVEITVHDGLNFSTPLDTVTKQLGTETQEANEVFVDHIYEHNRYAKTIFRYHADGRDGDAARWIIISNFRSN